jgi:hypothetical protein
VTALAAFCAWRRERLPLLPFVGVAVVVAAAAGEVGVVCVAVAFVWIAALRLWDDVATRESDARSHPARVLVRGPLPPFLRAVVVVVGAAVVAAALVDCVLGFVGLLLGLSLAYAAPLPRLALQLVVITKYPVMAWLLASSSSQAQLLPLFVCFVVDEFVTGERRLVVRALPFALTFFWLCL